MTRACAAVANVRAAGDRGVDHGLGIAVPEQVSDLRERIAALDSGCVPLCSELTQ